MHAVHVPPSPLQEDLKLRDVAAEKERSAFEGQLTEAASKEARLLEELKEAISKVLLGDGV